MKHKHLALTLGALLISTLILLFSCKKINESTELGGDLIPVVDNINTFDTTLEVQAFNDTFAFANDTTYYDFDAIHYLGHIENDPYFGKTDAQLFLSLKPPFYKYNFGNKPDSLHIDSVVLILDYAEIYGDSTVPQTVNVYEIAPTSNFGDTILYIAKSNYPKAGLLGSKTFDPRSLNDSVKAYQDTSANQLRIRLDDAFGQRLLNYDTVGISGAYSSDSSFRTKFRGFALESVSGNALIGFNMSDTNTKLAIYYKDDNGDLDPSNAVTPLWDTAVAYFKFTGNTSSVAANYIKRDHSGTPLAAAADGITTPDNLVYIQNTPGSFATIKIPGLAALNNRIVHRAELIMEQVHDLSDTLFPPVNLYLDAYDPTLTNFRAIPYDIGLDVTGSSNLGSFGIAPVNTRDPQLNPIKSWRFNLTRYVQHVVNDTEPVYDLRLFSPLYIREYYRPGVVGSNSTLTELSVNGTIGKGRVRLAGNTGPTDTNPQRMRLRIVYSKI